MTTTRAEWIFGGGQNCAGRDFAEDVNVGQGLNEDAERAVVAGIGLGSHARGDFPLDREGEAGEKKSGQWPVVSGQRRVSSFESGDWPLTTDHFHLSPHFDEQFRDEGARGVVGEVADEFQFAMRVGGAQGAQGVQHAGFYGVFAGEDVGVEPADIGECGVVALCGGHEFVVDVDGEDCAVVGALGELSCEVADAGTDFEDDIVGGDIAGVGDGAEDVLIDHEVLAELMLRAESGRGENVGDFLAVHRITVAGGRGQLGRLRAARRVERRPR